MPNNLIKTAVRTIVVIAILMLACFTILIIEISAMDKYGNSAHVCWWVLSVWICSHFCDKIYDYLFK